MNVFLSVKEAAARAGVSEATVRSWIRDSMLAHFRLGAKGRRGKILVAAQDLDDLLASFRVVAAPANEPQRKPVPAARKPVLKHLKLK
jgi:excisionase family DNA binding protein